MITPGPAIEESAVSVAVGPFVGPVLRRVVGMLAARAMLPLDRLDDAVLVADVIASRAATIAEQAVTVRVGISQRELWLTVGRLRPGGAQAILDSRPLPNVASVVGKLADEVHITPDPAGGEELSVRLAYAAD